MHVLKRQIALPITLQEAWEFFSAPNNLAKITPGKMGFEITSEFSGKMYPGMIIGYKVKPLLGIRMNWVTEITHVQEPFYFVDEQRFGPYAFWHHKHYFKPIEGGVLCEDVVHYKAPLGPLGRVMNNLVIKKELKGIFDYREKVLKERFGMYNYSGRNTQREVPVETLITSVGQSQN